ncbi:MAG TPA: branched-chain amino acid ABC transporter permease, partial [Halobacteriales archaeon]|nr:branched-chain amino acid ABC transporter permease [Halobacteriales archaeon]
DGIGNGLLLALLGVGITLVFGLGELLNLAQGIFAVLGALVALEFVELGVPLPAAVVLSLLAIAAFSLLVDRGLLSSVYRSEGDERIMVGIFVTLGLTLAIEGLLFVYRPYRFTLPYDVDSVQAFGTFIRGASLLNILVASVVIAALFVFLRRTYLGNAARTITQDEVGASLCGIDTRRMRTIIFVTSAAIAAVAGLLAGIGGSLSAASGFELTVQALIVSIVGGVRNVPGTVVAGVGLGLVLAYANFFIGSYLALIAMFATAMAAIAVRREAFA